MSIKNNIGLNNQANREKWIEQKLKEIPQGSKILDAGAGELKYKKYCAHLKYESQDFAKYHGVGDSTGLQKTKWDQSRLDIVSDITSIPVSNESFDAVMCVEVFEHLPEPIKAIHEFSRILKTGGFIILTAPFCSLTHFAPFHFYSGFNRYFYQQFLPESYFEILEIIPNGNYFSYLAQEIRRIPFCAQKYASRKVNFFERISINVLLKMLNRFSGSEINCSNELLCFGYHILARKIK